MDKNSVLSACTQDRGAHRRGILSSVEEEAAYFNARAASWDSEHPPDAEKMRALVSCAEIPKGARVLDVGSGTGVAVPFLRERIGQKGRILCADVSEAMLGVSRSKHGDTGVEYLRVDITDASTAFNGLDAIVCYNVWPHIREETGVLNRMASWLRSGGTLLIAHGQGRGFINAMHGKMDAVVQNDRLPDMQTLRGMFLSAGLSIIREIDVHDRFAISGRRE